MGRETIAIINWHGETAETKLLLEASELIRSELMSHTTSHEWFHPKLTALIAEAEAAGIARDVSVAVITDLVNGPLFSTAPLQPDENWNQDIGEPDYQANINAPITSEPLVDDAARGSSSHVPGGNWF